MIRTISAICVVGLFILAGQLHKHYRSQSECKGTEYKYINEVLYCDFEGNWVKPKNYKRLVR